MTHTKKKVRRVKAWAIVSNSKLCVSYEALQFNKSLMFAVYLNEKEAKQNAQMEKIRLEVVPCTIAYSLNTK